MVVLYVRDHGDLAPKKINLSFITAWQYWLGIDHKCLQSNPKPFQQSSKNLKKKIYLTEFCAD